MNQAVSSSRHSSKRPANIAIIIVIIASLSATVIDGFVQGGPAYSCKNLTPGHMREGIQTANSPYVVEVASQTVVRGQPVGVRISGIEGMDFAGYLCSVSMMDDARNNTVGRWEVMEPSLSKTVDCYGSDPSTGVTHRDNSRKTESLFTWTPPNQAVVGDRYKLRCTVVQSFASCWIDMMVPLTVVDNLPPTPPPARPQGQNNAGSGTETGSSTTGTEFSGQGQSSGQRSQSTPASTGIISGGSDNNNNNGGMPNGGISCWFWLPCFILTVFRNPLFLKI